MNNPFSSLFVDNKFVDFMQRITTGIAKDHPWLNNEEPLPKRIDCMPKFKSRHDDSDL